LFLSPNAAYWASETITETGIGDIKGWGTAYIPLIEKGEADFKKTLIILGFYGLVVQYSPG
jgi:hypothetical protein